MAPPPTVSLLILLVLFLATAFATTVRPLTSAASSSSPFTAYSTASPAATAFLRMRCATTLYPAVCYDTLLPYAGTFQTSRPKLARAAADVAAARLRAFAARLRELLLGGTPALAPREAAMLRDCAITVLDAAGLAEQSSAEIGRLDTAPASGAGPEARWEVANAKTWLSAAMTNEGTCEDGFSVASEAEASLAAKEVAAGVACAKQYTSNALALVSGIPM